MIGRTQLADDLHAAGVREGGVLMVHTRMSALGQVIGGAQTVVEALLDAVGPGGTLMAYTGWEDMPPDDLDLLPAEQRELILAEHPAFEPHLARANRSHGRVPEALRTWPGVRHSRHPEAAVVAVGRRADDLVTDHPWDEPYGAGSPYARLVELDGQVLLLGAPLDTMTLLHHAETIARVPEKRRVEYSAAILVDGVRAWRLFADVDTGDGAFDYERATPAGVDPFVSIAQAALEAGCGVAVRIGPSASFLFDARRLVRHAVSWLEATFGPTD